jgi:hypothetical protein
VPADHHLADEVQALEVEALSGETLILSEYEEDAGFADYVTDFVAAARPMPEQVYRVRGIPTALSLAGAGVGVALVIESWRSLTKANVVYGEIVDYERIVDIVLVCTRARTTVGLNGL